MNWFRWLMFLTVVALPARAQLDAELKTTVRLVIAAETARPGDTVLTGIRFKVKPDWHIFWRAPVVGLPPSIKWDLPAGITAGEIQWPVPEKAQLLGEWDYVYEGEVTLLVPLILSATVEAGPHKLRGKLTWQECAAQCVRASAELSAPLTVGNETKPSREATELEVARQKLPLTSLAGTARVWWEASAEAKKRTLAIEWSGAGEHPDFIPYGNAALTIAAPTDTSGTGTVTLRKEVELDQGQWPSEVTGLLVAGAKGSQTGYAVKLPVVEKVVAGGAAQSPTPVVSPGQTTATDGAGGAVGASAADGPKSLTLWVALAFAFLGGLILNVMPCVLPVISMKVLSFVNQSQESRERRLMLGLMYGAGVVTSFLVLAGFVIAVQQAAGRAAWGMQFQDARFLTVMTILVTLISLNLFGVFEVTLPGSAMTAAAGAASREGAPGAFFNGVLAVVLATPCTAPFLGAAMGFAFAPGQSYGIIVLAFVMVGLGLALPFVILSASPALLRFLPKPGAWMEKFKIAMGFPMLATAVWLFSLTILHFGADSLWLGLFLVVTALAAWIYGAFVQGGRGRVGLSLGIAVTLLIVGYAYALESQLNWRQKRTKSAAAGTESSAKGKEMIPWQPWSTEAVAAARAAGRPVFVDFTATWCQICQFNKKTSIEIPSVRAKLKEINAVALLGDFSLEDETILEELHRFKRAGVPLVLIYPKDASKPPFVLPEALTPGIVLEKLDAAAK